MGADGITPVFSILIPEVFVRLYNEAIKKNVEKVFELQKIVSELNMVSKMATSPISARKFAISLLGLTSKKVTSPCEPLTEHEEKAIKSFVEHYLQLNESLRET
jgi:dihydrodipicolinate synthase/N-acetylneuraminate lyase